LVGVIKEWISDMMFVPHFMPTVCSIY